MTEPPASEPAATGELPAAASPAPRRHSALFDAAVAGVLFALTVLGIVAALRVYRVLDPTAVEAGPPPWLSIVAAGVLTLPLAWRRTAPVTVLAVVTAAFAAFRLLQVPEFSISAMALFIAFYTAGAEVAPRRSRPARAVAFVAMAALLVYQLVVEADAAGLEGMAEFDLALLRAFALGLNLFFFAAAWLAGDWQWRRRADAAELARHARELAASRETLARHAVQDERVRIARELHDIVAHHVSVMGIQAGAARRAVTRAPDQAEAALAGVEQASRDAIGELQRLLGLLRDDVDDADGAPVPAPRLGELDRLVDSVRDAGLEVEVETAGTPHPLPDSVEVSAYRIVQEALTNTLKHGDGATRSWIRLDYEDRCLRLTIRDDGTAAARVSADAAGRGVAGMRERAELHGGRLETAALPGGGFLVDVSLPLDGAGT